MTSTNLKKTFRKGQPTFTPITAPPRIVTAPIEPEFLRLPKPGLLCPITGLSRSAINQLILPCIQNKGRPAVRSFCLRQRGAKTGIRLVDYASLRLYIRRHEENTFCPPPRRAKGGGTK